MRDLREKTRRLLDRARRRQSPSPALRALRIGDAPEPITGLTIPWDDVDSLPSVIQYSIVIVNPSAGSEAAQRKAVELLRADLTPSAQSDTQVIVNEDTYGWERALTNTLWQAAVESLHELNFDRSRLYTGLYLAAIQRLTLGVSSYYDISDLPQRNLTLAHILQRQFEGGRLFSLCDGQNAGESFGWLLGGYGWGYDLPLMPPADLEELRRANRETYCEPGAVADLDYSRLSLLEDLKSRAATRSGSIRAAPVCSVAMIECGYLEVRADVRSALTSSIAEATLGFAAGCSYLSDDAIADLLLELVGAPDSGPGRFDGAATERTRSDVVLSAGQLVDALACASPLASDHYRIIEEMAKDLPCASVHWDVSVAALAAARRDVIVADLARRCRA